MYKDPEDALIGGMSPAQRLLSSCCQACSRLIAGRRPEGEPEEEALRASARAAHLEALPSGLIKPNTDCRPSSHGEFTASWLMRLVRLLDPF